MHRPLIDDHTYAFFDVETTGLSHRYGDRICEVGILRIKKGKIAGSFDTLINPERDVSPGAFAVNGISEDMVRDKPLFHHVALRVVEMLSDAVIVCHNARFDLGFLESELGALGLDLPHSPVIDTLYLSRRCFRFAHNNLGAVAEALGIRTPHAHRAMGDVHTMWRVFERFADDLHARGVRTLEDLLDTQRLPPMNMFVGRPVLAASVTKKSPG